jgi:tripeptide aminopeptidase
MTARTEDLAARLMRYCAIDSQSDADSPSQPSTAIQLNLANLLVQELTDRRDRHHPHRLRHRPRHHSRHRPGPTIGFLAHVDTAPQFNATGVKPRVIRGYNGGAITYPDNPTLTLTPESSPNLAKKQGP